MESFPAPGRIIFSAYRKCTNSNPLRCGGISGDVTYNALVENVGNGLNKNNGVFTCPRSGLYMFSFSGTTYASDNYNGMAVRVYINGVEDFLIQNTDIEHWEHISHSWLSHLNVNDRVNLRITAGKMYDSSNMKIHFNGIQLK